MCMYSETSDKGHSERGQTPNKGHTKHKHNNYYTLCTKITFERGQPLYKGQNAGPNCAHY